MINSIESSIIAYFDNRLSNAERVDLMRQVNESEDARKLFRQHEVLRSLVQRAQARTVVDADTESLLLSKLSPVARTPIYRTIPFVRTFAGALAASALIFIGYFASSYINGKDNSADRPVASRSFGIVTNQPDKTDLTEKQIVENGHTIATQKNLQKLASHAIEVSARTYSAAQIPAASKEDQLQASNLPMQTAVSFAETSDSKNGLRPLSSIAESVSRSSDNIRISLQADSPPFNDHHFPGVSGGSGSIGYFISPGDIVNANFGYRASRLLPPSDAGSTLSTPAKHDDQFTGIWSAGLSIEHQVLAYDGRLIISASLGAGLQTSGNYEALNFSAVTPLGRNLLAGIGVSVSHEHFTTSTWPVSDPSSPSGFSLWTNSEAKNFLTASVYYVVSYAF